MKRITLSVWLIVVGVGLAACTSSKHKFTVTDVSTTPGQRYIGELPEEKYLSVLAPEGNWFYSQQSMKRWSSIRFNGRTDYSATSSRYRVSIGASSYIYNESNQLAFSTGQWIGPAAESFHESLSSSLETGDYKAGLDRYYRAYYNPKHNKEVGLGRVVPSLVKIQDYVCWQYNEKQSFGPDINGEWGNNYLTRLSIFIHCPVLINGKVGQLGVSYGVNIAVKQFRAAYGNNGPTGDELMTELTAQIKPSIESLQIHLPGVSQPPPKNDEAHKHIKRFGE